MLGTLDAPVVGLRGGTVKEVSNGAAVSLLLTPLTEDGPVVPPDIVIPAGVGTVLVTGVIVVACGFPLSLIVVTTIGAPVMLPALACPRSSLSAECKLWMLGWYALGTPASHGGGVLAANADPTTAAGSPVTEAEDAAMAIADATEGGT